MDSIRGFSWTNSNASRNYPFLDNTDLTLADAGFLPNDFIVDARIYIRNTYQAASSPYISKLQITADKAIVTVACANIEIGSAEFPYTLTLETEPNEAKGIYLGENGISFMAVCPIKQLDVLAGTFVVNLKALDTIQALNQSVYEFSPNKLRFVPAVCEYLPGPQVTSINGLTGDLVLRGETGIRVDKINDTDIKISIVGDSHFTRFNCVESPLENILTSFVEQLTVIHHPRAVNPNIPNDVPPIQTSRLKVMNSESYKDGSVDFSLALQDNLELDRRQAFRVTVQGNTITLGMAGG
jgi:hypothetical protein